MRSKKKMKNDKAKCKPVSKALIVVMIHSDKIKKISQV